MLMDRDPPTLLHFVRVVLVFRSFTEKPKGSNSMDTLLSLANFLTEIRLVMILGANFPTEIRLVMKGRCGGGIVVVSIPFTGTN